MYVPSISHQYDGDEFTQWGVKRELEDEDWGGEEDGEESKRLKATDYDLVNGEEEVKKKQRRERNKMAAAKCRQRRVDLTNALLTETEKLEDEKNRLEEDIRVLELQKSELQHILDSHTINCHSREERPRPMNSVNSTFAFQGVRVMEVNASHLDQFKRSQASGFLYPQHKQTGHSQDYNKILNHTKGNHSTNHGQYPSPHFHDLTEDSPNSSHHGFTPIHGGHQRPSDHAPRDFTTLYNHACNTPQHRNFGYMDNSCRISNILNREVTKTYHNNNNYISAQHPCDASLLHLQDLNLKPPCSLAYSYNQPNLKTSGDIVSATTSGSSSIYQETTMIESVFKVENHMNEQPMRHVTSS